MNKGMTYPYELPEGWVWTRLEAIALEPQYGWTTSAVETGRLRLLRTTDITAGKVDWNSVPFCKDEPPNVAKYLLHEGDIVISRAGSVGYSYLVKKPLEAVFASYLIRFRPLIDGSYFAMFSLSPSYWEAILERSIGIALANVNASKLKQIPFPLPPLPEQHRIVAKIEELFTRLDAGVEALKKIQAQLKRYRQSVLKHAFEGKLTAEWRQAHKDELEPASTLLERIKQERQKTAKAKCKELPPLDTSDLPKLPEGWAWARIGDICETTSGGTPSRRKMTYYGGDIPWLKSGELEDDVIKSVEEFITEEGLKNSSTKIIPKGSLLMALYGATVGKLGILAIDTAVNQAICAIFTPVQLDKKLLFWYLIKYRYELLAARRGGAQPNISQGIVNNIILPLSPLLEQKEIVSEIERRFSVADQIEKTVDHSLKQAERLRQSILRRAFEGKLVPQDPNDEPAERLLERIKAERSKHLTEEKAASKSKKRTHTKQMGLM